MTKQLPQCGESVEGVNVEGMPEIFFCLAPAGHKPASAHRFHKSMAVSLRPTDRPYVAGVADWIELAPME